MRRTAASALVACGLIALGAAAGVTRGGAPVAALAASPAPCASLAPTDAYLSEGPTSANDAARNIRSRGTFRAAVIFVDFSDAPGSEDPARIVSDWIKPGITWLRTSSYGRFRILPQAASAWVRMPHPAASYGYASTYDTHHQYIADAIAAADPTFDFSQTDIVFVVAAKTNRTVISNSPTFRAVSGELAADGRQLGPAVTFGFDAYSYGRTILPHETGHLLGLPDLYAFTGTDIHRFVGSWDLMGDVFDPTDLTAWHRLKLGWLDAGQVVCPPRRGKRTVVLTPLGTQGGTKAVFVRTGLMTGLLVENRQPVANDRAICDRGALVYTVDSAIGSGEGPIKVVGGAGGCGHGPRSDAPLHLGQSVSVGGVRVTVVGAHRSNIRVQVASR
jgi:M6 family metalloprotease-like protein